MSDDANKPTPDPDGSTGAPDGAPAISPQEYTDLKARAEKAEADAKAYRERFELEKKERDARTQAARKKAEEDGQYEKLAAELKAENEALKTRASDYEAVKAKLDEIEQQRRDELLAQLPKDAQDEWKDADVTTLSKVVKLAATQQPNIPGTHTGGSSAAKVGAKSWGDMTGAERAAFTLEHPNEVGAKIRAWRAGK